MLGLAQGWRGPDGKGSLKHFTQGAQKALRQAISLVGAKSVVDLGCGSCAWQLQVIPEGVSYVGLDVRSFDSWPEGNLVMDIIKGELPPADLYLARDVFIHLKDTELVDTIKNLLKSKARFLLVPSSVEERGNERNCTRDMSNWLHGAILKTWPDCGRDFQLWDLNADQNHTNA